MLILKCTYKCIIMHYYISLTETGENFCLKTKRIFLNIGIRSVSVHLYLSYDASHAHRRGRSDKQKY